MQGVGCISTMNREDEKAEYEKDVFYEFLGRSKLEIDRDSVKNGDPNQQEPDLLCRFTVIPPFIAAVTSRC